MRHLRVTFLFYYVKTINFSFTLYRSFLKSLNYSKYKKFFI